jgi:hypothetical protein
MMKRGDQREGVLDLRAFAETYARAVEAAYPGEQAEIEFAETAAETSVSWHNGNRRAFLGNAYSDYLKDPDALDRILRAHLAMDVESQTWQPAGDTRHLILPVIKPKIWLTTALDQLKALGVQTAGDDLPFIVTPLVGDVLVTYVEDGAHGMRFLSPALLTSLEISRDELDTLALANLTELALNVQCEGGNGRFRLRLDGSYEASLILLIEQWYRQLDLAGDPVFAIPARDELLVCGSADTESVSGLRMKAAEIAAASGYSISERLFAWRNNEIVHLDRS